MPTTQNHFHLVLTEEHQHVIQSGPPFSALLTHLQFRPSTGRFAQKEKDDVYSVVLALQDGGFITIASFSASAPSTTFSFPLRTVVTSGSGVKSICLRRYFADASMKRQGTSVETEETPGAPSGAHGALAVSAAVIVSGVQMTTLTEEQISLLQSAA
mmetsp:Transcript_65201/g.75824  ORF Transcript_65201/g.75824 Transcript_65201/m.75824 type:complete len:157 (+) Transcript_65201:46-516(+)